MNKLYLLILNFHIYFGCSENCKFYSNKTESEHFLFVFLQIIITIIDYRSYTYIILLCIRINWLFIIKHIVIFSRVTNHVILVFYIGIAGLHIKKKILYSA